MLIGFYTDSQRHVDEPMHFWKFYLAFDHSETVETEEIDEIAPIEIGEFLNGLLM